MHVAPDTHAVGPVYPCPPHCPYCATAGPVGALLLLLATELGGGGGGAAEPVPVPYSGGPGMTYVVCVCAALLYTSMLTASGDQKV